MDIFVILLAASLFVYACYVHSKESDSPEEYPTRLIMLLTFIFLLFRISEYIGIEFQIIVTDDNVWQIVALVVLWRITHFLGNRNERIHGVTNGSKNKKLQG